MVLGLKKLRNGQYGWHEFSDNHHGKRRNTFTPVKRRMGSFSPAAFSPFTYLVEFVILDVHVGNEQLSLFRDEFFGQDFAMDAIRSSH